MKAEGGDGKERKVLIYQTQAWIQPQQILGMVVEMTCPGLPSLDHISHSPVSLKKMDNGPGLWTHQQKWQYASQMSWMKASQSISKALLNSFLPK